MQPCRPADHPIDEAAGLVLEALSLIASFLRPPEQEVARGGLLGENFVSHVHAVVDDRKNGPVLVEHGPISTLRTVALSLSSAFGEERSAMPEPLEELSEQG